MLLTEERSRDYSERIKALVNEALEKADISARRASLDVVGNDGLVRDIRAGVIPSADRLEALFSYLGLEFYFGPRRIPSGQPGLAEDGNVVSLKPRRGWVPIPWHDDDRHPGAPPVAFDPAWLTHHQLATKHLAMVAPIRAGDTGQRDARETLALVDRNAPHQGGPHLWALLNRQSVMLRMVQFVGPDILVLPPRPGEAAQLHRSGTTDHPSLLGRVIWTGTLA